MRHGTHRWKSHWSLSDFPRCLIHSTVTSVNRNVTCMNKSYQIIAWGMAHIDERIVSVSLISLDDSFIVLLHVWIVMSHIWKSHSSLYHFPPWLFHSTVTCLNRNVTFMDKSYHIIEWGMSHIYERIISLSLISRDDSFTVLVQVWILMSHLWISRIKSLNEDIWKHHLSFSHFPRWLIHSTVTCVSSNVTCVNSNVTCMMTFS